LYGCFIFGILTITGIFLYSMHYTVQIASYFQPNAKLRRVDFPRFPNFHLPSLTPNAGHDTYTNGPGKSAYQDGNIDPPKHKIKHSEPELEAYGSEADAEAKPDDDKDDVGATEEYEYGYGDINGGEASTAADGKAADGVDDDDRYKYGYDDGTYEYDDDQNDEAEPDDDDDDDAAIVPIPPHAQSASQQQEQEYGYFEEDDKNHGNLGTTNNQAGGSKPASADSEPDDKKHVAVTPTDGGKPGKAPPPNTTGGKKPKRPRDPYNYVVDIDPDWGVEGKWDLKYIKVMPTKKPLLKKDRRVVFPNFTHHAVAASGIGAGVASREAPSGVPGSPRELLKANAVLERHPVYQNKQFDMHTHSLEDVMYYIKHSPTCLQQPIYITMATVGDDLYWQLIENFVYTLVKFEVSDCALVICVSDLRCMRMCAAAKFPCFNYIAEEVPLPSVMEQIAQVKLLHVPKALNRGVSKFWLCFTYAPFVSVFCGCVSYHEGF
jgi:hypothetical protein